MRADRPPQAPPRLPCRCIPGAGEARDEAAAAAMRSRWLARRAPASEAGLTAGSGLRRRLDPISETARSASSPLSTLDLRNPG